MSQITIQSRLIASESTRQKLWKLMAQLNTPLINELLQQLSKNQDFDKWRKDGKLPSTVVSQLCQPLKTDPRFAGQPSRLYLSAIVYSWTYADSNGGPLRCQRSALTN